MDSDLVFRYEDVSNSHGRPLPYFEISGDLENGSKDRSYAVLSLQAELRCLHRFHLPIKVCGFFQDRLLEPGDKMHGVRLRVDMPYTVLDFIEEQRNGEAGVEFELTLSAMVFPQGGAPRTLDCEIVGNKRGLSKTIAIDRDSWCQMLGQLGWDEVAIFELHTHQLKANPSLKVGLSQLQKAVSLMRTSDHWEEVLAATRKAFEAAATATGETDKTKLGFQKLWEAVFPDQKDAKLVEAVDGLTKASAEFQHVARHSKHPFPTIGRKEALLGLRITLALFDYLSNRLSMMPKP